MVTIKAASPWVTQVYFNPSSMFQYWYYSVILARDALDTNSIFKSIISGRSVDNHAPNYEKYYKSQLRSMIMEVVIAGNMNTWVNSLWPRRFQWKFRWVLFKLITVIDGWDPCCEIALRRMSLDLTDDKSTFVQVKAWCRQATIHYLSQCWPSFLWPYGVTRPKWVKFRSGEVMK